MKVYRKPAIFLLVSLAQKKKTCLNLQSMANIWWTAQCTMYLTWQDQLAHSPVVSAVASKPVEVPDRVSCNRIILWMLLVVTRISFCTTPLWYCNMYILDILYRMLISNKRYFCVCFFFVTWLARCRGCRWPGRPPVGGAAEEKEGGGWRNWASITTGQQ